MTTAVLRPVADAFTNAAASSKNYGQNANLSVDGSGTPRRSYIRFGVMPPHRSTILSATMKLILRGSGWAGGPHTVTVRGLTQSWRESKIDDSNAPTSTATHQATASVTGGSDGDELDIDITNLANDAVVAGISYGFRITVDTSGRKDFYSAETADADFHPRLVVHFAAPPDAPTDLRPNGGQYVSIAKPVVQFHYHDTDGDEQAHLQVQISSTGGTTADFNSPEFDSGTVDTSDPELDLSTTSWAGISAGASRWWRARVKDVSGTGWSEWSDIASFQRKSQGTLTLVSPGTTTNDSTPQVDWTLSGTTQTSYRVQIWEKQTNGLYPRHPRFTTGKVKSTATLFSVPDIIPGTKAERVIRHQGRDYELVLDVWDDTDRVGTPGDPVHVRATQIFQWVDGAGTRPSNLVLTADPDGGPAVTMAWDRVTEPDAWVIFVDGEKKHMFDGHVPIDGTGHWSIQIYDVPPGRALTLDVKAHTDGTGNTAGATNGAQTITIKPKGTWLVEEDDNFASANAMVQLIADDQSGLTVGESSAVFNPVGARVPVYIRDAVRGQEGPVVGLVQSQADRLQLLDWKADERTQLRLVFGRFTGIVELGPMTEVPAKGYDGKFDVTLQVMQVGHFEVDQ